MTFSLSATIAPIKTRIKSTIDIFLAIDSKFGVNFLNTIPITNGTVTSINIKIALAITEIFLTSSPKYSAEFITMIGTVTTDIKLIIAVNETDNETSPFAKAVYMLDLTKLLKSLALKIQIYGYTQVMIMTLPQIHI